MEEKQSSVGIENNHALELSNFFNGISYDFKTVASLILSSAESMLETNENSNKEELHLIRDNSKLLLRMINQLLEVRKLENEDFELKISETDIVDFIKEIFQEFHKDAIKKNIEFNFTENVVDPYLFIDRELIYNSVYNLLINAFKFTTF